MKQKLVYDIECSPDYFMVGFMHTETRAVRQYELFAGHPLARGDILAILQNFTVIGFNSIDYDIGMLLYALMGSVEVEKGELTIEELLVNLKRVSDHIIVGGLKGWQVEQEYGFKVPSYIDHIDLKEPVPGVAISLKLYGGRLHSKRIQDLPYEHNERVFGHPEDRRAVILDYNRNDLETTLDLWFEATKPSDNIIATRELIGAEFGIDLRSKSDAQIAEAAIKTRVAKLKGAPIYKSDIRPGTAYTYQPPAFISFKTEAMRKVFTTVLAASFVVNAKGSIEMPPNMPSVTIGGSTYTMGIGGLHSTEKRRAIFASDQVLLRDFDVTSFYPALILLCGLFPPNMGELFQRVYKDFFDRRLAAKKAGHKSTAQTLKIVLNGTFGKLGSKFSVLYAPNLLIQVTLTGQLALLMLIERMELAGIPVISANTDGIVMATPKAREAAMYEVVKQWERDTGLGLEETRYKAVCSRDVNTYLAITEDGKAKTKGALAPSDAQHNPSFEIVKQAAIQYVAKGTPVAETILKCRDVRQFVAVTRVTGGAQMPSAAQWIDHWNHDGEKWVMQHGTRTFKEKRKSRPAPVLVTSSADYLGKVVRWFRSTKSTQHIERVANGGKVPNSDNARPLMTLPDVFPDDIDYGYYVAEANALLRDIGVMQ